MDSSSRSVEMPCSPSHVAAAKLAAEAQATMDGESLGTGASETDEDVFNVRAAETRTADEHRARAGSMRRATSSAVAARRRSSVVSIHDEARAEKLHLTLNRHRSSVTSTSRPTSAGSAADSRRASRPTSATATVRHGAVATSRSPPGLPHPRRMSRGNSGGKEPPETEGSPPYVASPAVTNQSHGTPPAGWNRVDSTVLTPSPMLQVITPSRRVSTPRGMAAIHPGELVQRRKPDGLELGVDLAASGAAAAAAATNDVEVMAAGEPDLRENRLIMVASPTHAELKDAGSTDARIRALYKQAVTSDFARFGNPEVVYELCKEPVNLQEVKRRVFEHPEAILLLNASGNTALHYVMQAIKSKWLQSEIMLTFLTKGACLYTPNRRRETPFKLITTPERKADMTFSTVSEAIRAYQSKCEGRVPFYKGTTHCLEEIGFHVFSQVFKGKDGSTPLVYCGNSEGLKIFDVSEDPPVLLQHYPTLHLHSFRTAVERGGSRDNDHEILIEETGGIFRFRHVEPPRTHELLSTFTAYKSPLRGMSREDSVVGSILPTGVRETVSRPSSLPPVKEARWKKPFTAGSSPRPSVSAASMPDMFLDESKRESLANEFGNPFVINVFSSDIDEAAYEDSGKALVALFGDQSLALSPVANGPGRSRSRRSFHVVTHSERAPVEPGSPRHGAEWTPVSSPSGTRGAKRIREGAVVDLGVLEPTGGPLLEVITPCSTPFLACCSSPNNTEACCDVYLSHTGPSCGQLMSDQPAKHITKFDFRVIVIGGADKGKSTSFYSSGHMLGDSAWVYANCHVARRTISGRPVALKQAGNGDYVCLADTSGIDRVVVFSSLLGNVFYNICLDSPTARPISIVSKLTKDIVISDREMPCVAIVTDVSVEVHQLTLSKADMSEVQPNSGELEKGGWTTKLCYNILNDTIGGRYSCAFSDDPADKKLLILRGSVAWFDICLCDTLANRCYYICKVDRMQERREKSVANIGAFLSKDGRYLLRRNPDCGLSTVFEWNSIEEIYKRDREPINMTFSPFSLTPVKLDVFSVAPPQGMLNLVFTDVQSSTSLWEREPEAMQQALDLHNKLLRRAMMRFCGYEVKTEGDAFMVAFHHTIDAVNWCLVSQLLLLMAPWPEEILKIFPAEENSAFEPPEPGSEYAQQQEVEDTDVQNTVQGIGGDPIPLAITAGAQRRLLWRGLRVRMGIHRCKPLCKIDPSSKRMDYFGPPVNLSARISGHGKGGQVILTQQVADVLEADARQSVVEVWVKALGDVQLKGIREKHSLYELLPMSACGRSEEFAGADAAAASPKGFAESMNEVFFQTPHMTPSPSPKGLPGAYQHTPRTPPRYPGVPTCTRCGQPFFDAAQKFCGDCGKRRLLDVAAL